MGDLAIALGSLMRAAKPSGARNRCERAGLGAWILQHLRRQSMSETRLVLLERVTIAPRQTVALIEADGRRVLVAASPECTPTFFPLDTPTRTKKCIGKINRSRQGQDS